MATVNPMAVVLVVLIVVPLIPLLTLGILAVRNVKNLSDPVRHGLIWFHCAIWFYFVYVDSMPSTQPVCLFCRLTSIHFAHPDQFCSIPYSWAYHSQMCGLPATGIKARWQ